MTDNRGLSRRTLLAGLAATSTSLPLTGLPSAGSAQPVVRPKTPSVPGLLPSPVLPTVLRDAHMLARVRPHRTSGIRLEAEPIESTPQGPRVLIHNYGHSGAGITLSWGSAAKVAEEVRTVLPKLRGKAASPSIAVIGCGIIGLTTARQLKRRFPRLPLVVYAKSLDVRQTTSYIAGGQFEPSLIWRNYDTPAEQAQLTELMMTTRRWIEEVLRERAGARYGVAPRRNFTLDGPPNGLDYAFQRGVLSCPPASAACRSGSRPSEGDYERIDLPLANLQQATGREYATWLINPSILMPRLVAELRGLGVRFIARELADRSQLMRLPHTIIVNCSGYGARRLLDDKDMVARRGHLVVLPNRGARPVRYFLSGGCGRVTRSSSTSNFYMFGRQSDIVLGGTVIDGDEREGIDRSDPRERQICERILENARAIFLRGDPGACTDPGRLT